MQSEHEHPIPPDAIPSAPFRRRETPHVGRYSEGQEKLPDSPDKQHVGRYGNGFEQIPHTPGEFHIRHHRKERKRRRKT